MKPSPVRRSRKLAPYVPGRPIEEVEAEYGITGAVKLASNENPLGPSPKGVAAAIAAAAGVHLYPGRVRDLPAARARPSGTAIPRRPDRPRVGLLGAHRHLHAGLRRPGRRGRRPGRDLPDVPGGRGARRGDVRRGPDEARLPAGRRRAAAADRARDEGRRRREPEQPDGRVRFRRTSWTGSSTASRSTSSPSSTRPTSSSRARSPTTRTRSTTSARGSNVLVLRTFSKIYGLAGLRIGYGFTPPDVAVAMNKVREPFNTTIVAQAAALAALSDDEHCERTLRARPRGTGLPEDRAREAKGRRATRRSATSSSWSCRSRSGRSSRSSPGAASSSGRWEAGASRSRSESRSGPATRTSGSSPFSTSSSRRGSSACPRKPSRRRRMIVVAIDGPSGVGKSTVGKALAARLGVPYLDTGAMYRAVGLLARRNGVPLPIADPDRVGSSRRELRGPGHRARAGTSGRSSTGRTSPRRSGSPRSPSTPRRSRRSRGSGGGSRPGSASWRSSGGGVLEGRDIGTKVVPEATAKFFLTARPEVRARRRFEELARKGTPQDLAAVRAEMDARDEADSTRADSPLACDETYVVVDTSDLGPEEVAERLRGARPGAARTG